ncbi:related to PRM1 - Pheromone-regulated multispanning membrane protein [Melanopsichium pennsylvanicum]|uniref:Plasma membrane fusion protein PRM1 n=2 Tax=Melanopsichium pennsylvanicum TaxID=63383 RepID=A0AAJ4XMF4_9BASI|nr:related to PRM1-Pheromone-regulated multispanning membrane protein [Melanopsichium pennsylvanicum 4]SNX84910.1 related to PRM1 - Pheromone-regulated multispanning membrane protein [Melanopsichium pennsylvanicum]
MPSPPASISNAHLDEPPSYLLTQRALASPPYSQHNFPSPSPATSMRSPTLAPYVGLRARVLLSPICIPLISLLFVAFRLISSSTDMTSSVITAKSNLLSSCTNIEATASLIASLPHFLASSTNAHLASSITSTVHGAARVFDLSMTAIENILIYFVDSYRSLFLCFLELLVRGSLAVLIEAVQLISEALTGIFQGIRAAIQESVSGINTLLATAVSGINDVVRVFGQHIQAPTISVPALTALDNVTLPHEIEDGLLKLNATLPTLQQLKDKMDALIETPFEAMKTEVNETLMGFTFNQSVFPLPEMRNVSFCDRIDTTPIDHLGQAVKDVAHWSLVMLALVAVVVILVAICWEWWKWNREMKSIERTRMVWLAQTSQDQQHHPDGKEPDDVLQTRNLTQLLAISRHPLVSSFSLSFCNRVGIRTKRAQDRVSWFVSFVSHPAALACLFTGLLGLLSVMLQSFLLHRLTHSYTNDINTSLTHLSSEIVDMVNTHTQNASYEFSQSANAVILDVQTELNSHVFSWVNTTTFTMNSTLNEFLDGITDALTTTFGGTPFNAPLQTFVQCIVGQKVKGIEKALTWISDNAHVSFDLVSADVLMLKGQEGEMVLAPVREALAGSGGDGDHGGIVGQVKSRYEKHLKQEKLMFLILVGVYLAILLIGMLVVVYAILADQRLGAYDPIDGTKSMGEKGDPDEVDKELRRNLESAPQNPITWFLRFLKPHHGPGRLGRVSPFITKTRSPARVNKDIHPPPSRRISIAHSNSSKRTHVIKDSISYPFQIHHSLTTSSPETRQQPTPLRQVAASVRDTVLSVCQAQPDRISTLEKRSSWLSFLAKLSIDDEAAKGGKAETMEGETSQERFERLFGCSPVASATTPHFPSHLSTAGRDSFSGANQVDVKGKAEGCAKYRETLELMPGQAWMGGRSPIPIPTQANEGEPSAGGREVSLNRSSMLSRGDAKGEESYAFGDAPGGYGQQQQAIRSPQSISFYAW